MMSKGVYQSTQPVWQPNDGLASRFYFCCRLMLKVPECDVNKVRKSSPNVHKLLV